MTKLDSPAAPLRVKYNDIRRRLEDILTRKNWKDFDPSHLELNYVPYYVFNYDAYGEVETRQGTKKVNSSGKVALNAVEGEIETAITGIMSEIPLDFDKELPDEFDEYQVNTDVKKPAITKKEVKEVSKVKVARLLGVNEEDVTTSAFRMVYWPIWSIFVRVGGTSYRLEVDGTASQIFESISQGVPSREKGWLEISKDTFEKLQSPSGWAELGGVAVRAAGSGLKTTISSRKRGSGSSGVLKWLFRTSTGRYTLLLVLVLIFLVVFFA